MCFVRGGLAGPKCFLNSQSTADIIASQLVDELYKCNNAEEHFKFLRRFSVGQSVYETSCEFWLASWEDCARGESLQFKHGRPPV
jgi:hypothetical protein